MNFPQYFRGLDQLLKRVEPIKGHHIYTRTSVHRGEVEREPGGK